MDIEKLNNLSGELYVSLYNARMHKKLNQTVRLKELKKLFQNLTIEESESVKLQAVKMYNETFKNDNLKL